MKQPNNIMTAIQHDGVKALLGRWSQKGLFQEYDLQIKLWCEFEGAGFTAIRLWIEPYERSHGFWRFSVGCARRTSCMDVESAVKAACKRAGYAVKKDFVAAVVAGGRARGGFILPNERPTRAMPYTKPKKGA